MYNTGIIRFKQYKDGSGNLTPIEAESDIPFAIKRIYYIYDVVPDATRGYHSHKKLHQVLIPLNGSITVRLITHIEEKNIVLNSPHEGLYIGPHVWREMYDFSPGSVLLVLASDFYDEADYIRDFNSFLETNPFRGQV
ncbi:MAG: FdtA/QdtA family cupin domain-containing protein [Defluviitaleaceae bacterium]|nr:FdtA/QdtA family cupin domain-containing protein [Defluviitaleaceae bacterium]